MTLTLEQIAALDDRKIVEVQVPEWGGSVRIRELSGALREEWEEACFRARDGDKSNFRGMRALLIVLSLCDDNGRPTCPGIDDADPAKRAAAIDAGRDALMERAYPVLERLYEQCDRLSKTGDRDIEEISGNSSGGPSAAHGSSSPSIGDAL